MRTPLVSIIVPVYNTEKYLMDTIRTIQKQTLSDFEVICVDDGSTDRTLAILDKVSAEDRRFSVLRQKNAGAGAARNYGFTVAQGKYAIFLDSDDLFSPQLLEKLYAAAEEHQADIAACNFTRFDESGNIAYRNGVHTEWLPKDVRVFNYRDCPHHILNVVNPTPWNKLYRSDFIRKHNLKYEEISSTNDITFAAVSVATAERVAIVPEYLVQYRVGHSGSISSTKTKNLNNVHIAVSSAVRQAKALPHCEQIMDAILRFSVDNYVFALKNYVPDFDAPEAAAFYETVHQVFNGQDFDGMLPTALHNEELYRDFYTVKKHGYDAMKALLSRKMIVSLTTFPGRIATLSKVLDTIYLQTRPADRIVLWLAAEQFPQREAELPEDLRCLMEDGRLEVRWCADLKPHKKYFYALQEFTEDLVVTIDDDLLYPNDMLQKLHRSYLMYPEAVSTLRAHLILIDENNQILPYNNWVMETDALLYEPSMQLLATGGAGVLYPPKLFRQEFFDEAAVMETCLWADDLWLKAMQTVSNVPVVVARKSEQLHYLPDTQENALCHSNVDQSQNDVQLEKINQWLDRTFAPGIFTEKLTNLDVGTRIIGLSAVVAYFDQERKQLKSELSRARRRSGFGINQAAVSQLNSLGDMLKQLKESGHRASQLRKARTIYILAWLPGKYLGFLQCILDHGFPYTIRYSFIKLKRFLFGE